MANLTVVGMEEEGATREEDQGDQVEEAAAGLVLLEHRTATASEVEVVPTDPTEETIEADTTLEAVETAEVRQVKNLKYEPCQFY